MRIAEYGRRRIYLDLHHIRNEGPYQERRGTRLRLSIIPRQFKAVRPPQPYTRIAGRGRVVHTL